MACALLVSGCASGTADVGQSSESTAGDAATSSATSSPTSSPTSSLAPEPMDPMRLVSSVEIRPADLPPGYGPNVMQSGDEVEGQVTLDMCGAYFASEALRTARHQVAYRLGDPEAPGYDVTADGASVMSEAVAYSPGGARQAIREVRDAVDSCPRSYVPSLVGGAPPARNTLTPIPAAPDWQDDHVAVVNTLRFRTGESFRMALIYQRRGDLLAMAYVMTTKGGDGVALARDLGSLLSARLDAVTDPTGSNPEA